MPRGGSRGRYSRVENVRPEAAELRGWYEAHKDLSAEKVDLMYLTEGDSGQMMRAARKLLAADKAKYRPAVQDAFLGMEESERVNLLGELARADKELAVPMLQEIAAGSGRWEADQAKQLLKRLKVKVQKPPQEKEPGEEEDKAQGDEADEPAGGGDAQEAAPLPSR
jgi:hypothetical protein